VTDVLLISVAETNICVNKPECEIGRQVDLTDSEQLTSELMIKDEHVEDEQDNQGK
jgi:hypothetical protein